MTPIKTSMISKKEISIFTIAVLYRLLIFLALIWWSGHADFNYPLLGSDANGYWNLAERITTEHAYAVHDQQMGLLRPPGYPLYIAIFQIFLGTTHRAQYAAAFIQIILAAYTVILLYRLLMRVVPEKTAWLAALFFALEPNSAYYSTLLLSDTLFVFLLVAFVYIFLMRNSYGALFLAGVLLGVAMLMRPIAQFIPLLVILYLVWAHGIERRIIVCAAAFFLGAIMLPLLWMFYNNATSGNFILSSSGANTYYKYVMPQFEAWRTGMPHAHVQEKFEMALDEASRNTIQQHAFMQSEIKRIVRNHPFSYAEYHIIKTVPFFLGDGIREILQKVQLLDAKQPNISTLLLQRKFKEITNAILKNPHLLIAVGGGLFWSMILMCCLGGFLHGIRHSTPLRHYVVFFAAIILYLTILTGPATSTRHRMPALPFIAALAAMGVISLTDKYKIIRDIPRARNF